MAVRLVVAPDAELDIREAYTRYEGRRAGLGEGSSVRRSVYRGHPPPTADLSRCSRAYRRALIRRFPYAIFFELVETTVTVYAVFHTSRDPEKWRQRLP